MLLLALSLGSSPPLPQPVDATLAAGVEAWKARDTVGAISSLEAWKDAEVGPWGRERQAGLYRYEQLCGRKNSGGGYQA